MKISLEGALLSVICLQLLQNEEVVLVYNNSKWTLKTFPISCKTMNLIRSKQVTGLSVITITKFVFNYYGNPFASHYHEKLSF